MDEVQRIENDLRFKALVIEYRNGNKESLTELVILCEPLVIHMSRKYYNLAMLKNVPLEDLKQECYVGLLGAISRFPTNVEGNSFRSYACSAMNYQVLNYFRNHTDRIVKTNISKGYAEFESMDKEKSSFGELEDPKQEESFDFVIDNIDKEIQRKSISKLMKDVLCDETDIQLLRDMYGLDGQVYSIYYICEKYGLSLKALMAKERLMILKIQNSSKLENYVEQLDYCSKEAYKYSVNRFKDTRISSTEFIAMKHIQYEEQFEVQPCRILSSHSAKSYLKQVYRLREKIKDMEMDLMLLKSTKNDVKIKEYHRGIQDVTEQLNALIAAVKQHIDTVKDERCAMVLNKRYVELKEWSQICDEMQLSASTVHKNHAKGLKLIEPVYLSKKANTA